MAHRQHSHREGPHDLEKEMKHHKHLERLAKAGAIAAGTYTMHEKRKAKKEPEHAHKHKIEEEIAAVVAIGSAGFAFHEHHKKKEANDELKEEKHHQSHHSQQQQHHHHHYRRH